MDKGRLCPNGDENAKIDINYRLNIDAKWGWRGEFVLKEYIRLGEGDDYVIELGDGRKGACSIRKKVNKAVRVGPPHYYYSFRGRGKLE